MEETVRSYTLYMHTSPSGKRYIGITGRNTTDRWGKGGKGYETCSYFWNAITKYGWNNITHQVLAEGLTEAEAKQREKDLILAYKTRDPLLGYNLTDGGDGRCGCIPSAETRAKLKAARKDRIITDETRAKISAANMGKTRTAETKQKMSVAQMGNQKNLGRKPSDSTRAKMSAAQKGRTHTVESKQKMSAAHKGKIITAETKQKMRAARIGKTHSEEAKKKMSEVQRLTSKNVECLTISGEIIGYYNSLAEAAEKTGICKTSIGSVCHGKQKTAGTFCWRFANGQSKQSWYKESDETKQKRREAWARRVKDVECLTLEGDNIALYITLGEAAQKTGICRSNISRVCLGHGKTAGGFRWRYAVKD